MAHDTNRQTHSTGRDARPLATRAVGSVSLAAAYFAYGLARLACWADSSAQVARPEAKVRPADAEPHEPDADPHEPAEPARAPEPPPKASLALRSGRRLGAALVFATLFFAGAALSAIAGDTVSTPEASGQVPDAACGDPSAAPAEEDPADDDPTGCETDGAETETGATTGPDAAAEPSTTVEPSSGDPSSGETTAPGPATDPVASPPPAQGTPAPPAAPAAAPDPSGAASGGGGPGTPLVDARAPGAPTVLDPEAKAEGAVVWLHRTLPDPTPYAERLAPAFARGLRATAVRHRIPWAFLLGVVRAEGHRGRVPVDAAALTRTAGALAGHRDAIGAYRPWQIALRHAGRTAFADRALALTRYNRAVGLRALVTGLAAARDRLADRVLADRAIEVYAGGRSDIAAGRTDVRVLVLLRYLRIAHGHVTVSSLTSGHGVYARPGVVSAHTYGLAVDIGALGGQPIAGNQAPNGLAERAVRNILLLPAELAPQQVISLLGLGGASFPLGDHHDHIHVGY